VQPAACNVGTLARPHNNRQQAYKHGVFYAKKTRFFNKNLPKSQQNSMITCTVGQNFLNLAVRTEQVCWTKSTHTTPGMLLSACAFLLLAAWQDRAECYPRLSVCACMTWLCVCSLDQQVAVVGLTSSLSLSLSLSLLKTQQFKSAHLRAGSTTSVCCASRVVSVMRPSSPLPHTCTSFPCMLGCRTCMP
jgi:hypothetical protein